MATQAELVLLLRAKEEISAELKKISKELGTMGGATKAPQSGFNSLFATIAKGAAIVGGLALVAKAASGIGDAVSSAVGSAIGFEKSMSAIKANSGATAAQMQDLSQKALELGKATAFSASEAASGINELVKGGVSVADIMGGAASAALDLAAAGGVSVGEAATIAANAMNQFNLSGDKMAHVADMVAGAAVASTISVSDFNFSLAAVGSAADLAGQSFDSTATAITLMGAAGKKGSDAGTSLKAMLNNLLPSTDAATTKMRELGIITATGANQFVDAQGKMKGMGEISQVLQTALSGLTDAQRLFTLELLFGSDGMVAAGVLAKAGGAGFAEMGDKMLAAGGAASIAKERLNNLSGDMEQLKGSVETAGIIIASEFLPALRGIAQGATAMVNAFAQEASTLIQTAKNIAGEHGIGLIPAALTAVEIRIRETMGDNAANAFHTVRKAVEDLAAAFTEAKQRVSEVAAEAGPSLQSALDATGQRAGDLAVIMRDLGSATDIATRKFGDWLVKEGLVSTATANASKETQSLGARMDALWAILDNTPIGKVIASFHEMVAVWEAGQASGTEFAVATGAAWDTLIGFAIRVKNAVGDAFNELADLLHGLPARFEADAGATGLAIVTGIVTALNPVTVANAVAQMVITGVGAALDDASTAGNSVGANIAKGMAAGVSGGIEWVKTAAINIATAAKAAAEWVLGEHSPSKVFEEIGANVDQGFIDGIDGMVPEVETAIGDLMTGAGEAATTAAVDAFAGLATALGAQFEKTFTIVEAAQNAIDNARSDLDRKFQRDTELEEIKFQRRLQDLREEAGRASVKDRKDVLQKIEQLQEDHGRKIIDAQQANLDRIAELEFDAADKIAQAQEKQNLARGAALLDFKRDTDELLRDTADKAIEIGKKASAAIALAMKESDKSIQEAKDRADEAIQSLRDNQDLSRNLRSVRDTFSEGQDAESKTRDRKQEDADLDYNLNRDLEKAKLKLGKDRGKAETEQDRRQLDIQYADEVQNLRDSFNEAKRDLARRRAIADDNDAFRKGQQKALQAFNDNLEDEALAKQVKRLREERDTRVKELQAALDDKRTQINQSEADEREALAKSSAEKLDDLKTKFYDKVGALNEESKSAFESLFEGIAAGVKAAAGAVNDLSVAINRVATTKGAPTPASGGGGIAAGDGQTFGGQTPDVQQMFLSAYGSRAAAEEAWIAQHNYEIDLGNLGRPPRTVNGVDMGPYNGEAGQSWFSTPEESGSNASDHFAGGGVIGGARGAARLVMGHGGEVVLTPEQAAAMGGYGGGGDIYLSLELDSQRIASATVPYMQGQLDRLVRLKLG